MNNHAFHKAQQSCLWCEHNGKFKYVPKIYLNIFLNRITYNKIAIQIQMIY